jgi:hypothetical protein
MKNTGVVFLFICALVCSVVLCASLSAQTNLASITGRVFDPNAAVIVEATVTARDVDKGIETTVQTNEEGIYHFANLAPGNYEFSVSKRGFKVIVKPGVTLHVADTVSMNFTMQVGSVSETVTVKGGALLVNTESATVSTIVDRQFAESLPLNGRSFQTLIQLTPGVVLTTSNGEDAGQFSVNGQRASANYWMVDGVSANIGVSSNNIAGNGLAGALSSFSVQGGTNSLVSVDALQEFRIQTSTYAPEFGRTPGAQISIITRSGTNRFRGTVFDYFRNDALDANDWFANRDGLPKPEERQNDFGGTLGGPIIRDDTFFFFSYEGLRLRLPQVGQSTVPDTNPADPFARQFATPAMQPYLNAYPLPNGPEILDGNGNPTGAAQFNSSFSNSSTLDAYSFRIDHKLNDKINLFGRYNYSPSDLTQRGLGGLTALSSVNFAQITTQTATVGASWAISSATANDLRFNYSRTHSSSHYVLDNFGGALPLASSPFPSPFTDQNSNFVLFILPLSNAQLVQGKLNRTVQRQINVIDNLSVQKGLHSLKFGVDLRRLSPIVDPPSYIQNALFLSVPGAQTGSLLDANVFSERGGTLLFRNLAFFGQDSWRILPRLTLTYGLRWDVDFTPSTLSGPSLVAAIGFNLNDLSNLDLAPSGPTFKTTYGNVAPRLGVAYRISQKPARETVLRGGFGVFYDLATQEVGNLIGGTYPFAARKTLFGTSFGGTATFPLSSVDAAPLSITPASLAPPFGLLAAFDPHLQLPYTLQWTVALEQALGAQQALSITYVGAVGRRLIQSAEVFAPNANLGSALLVSNAATSDYNALQVQFQRRLSRGLQALASYTWSHSIDEGSAGSVGSFSNTLVPGSTANVNRGPSDFDIRNGFSAGLTYDIPYPKINLFSDAILRGWSLENVIQARSAPPVDVYSLLFGFEQLSGALTLVRPDVVPGVPLYLYGSQYPGGKAFNSLAFTSPPVNPTTGAPLHQGNLERNGLRGFGAAQWDFAVHRDFPIRESLKLQFRAEMFNVLNHPSFGPPVADLSGFSGPFGDSTQMLGRSLTSGTLGGGAFNPLYQLGGPRSIQLALKLMF